MKNLLLITTLLTIVFAFTGCSTLQIDSGLQKEIYVNGEGKEFKASNFDGGPGITFQEKERNLARLIRAEADAYATKADADSRKKLIENALIGNVVAATGTDKKLVVVNNNPSIEISYFEPKYPGQKTTVRPNGGFAQSDIPKGLSQMTFWFNGKKKTMFLQEKKTPYEINGVAANYYVLIE